MGLPNLSGSNIQDTYQRVLQTDGGDLRDGTGSLVTLNNITASGNISASSFIYGNQLNIATAATLGSAKVTGNLTVNGDITSNNTHLKVLLPLTASGDISASGNITGNSIVGTLGTAAQGNITSLGTLTSLTVDTLNLNGNSISSTDDGDVYMVINNFGFDFEANTGDKFIFNNYQNNVDFHYFGENDSNLIYADASADKVGIGTATPTAKLHVVGDIKATSIKSNSHITASGNISSSGKIYGDELYIENHQFIQKATDGANTIFIVGPQNSQIRQSLTSKSITFGDPASGLMVNITSSANISASGIITAASFVGNMDGGSF